MTTITLTEQEECIVIAGVLELIRGGELTEAGYEAVDSLGEKLGIDRP